MAVYVEIAVNVPQVTGVFHYHLPPNLEGKVGVGHLVEAPFGKQQVQGLVLREIPAPEVPETRPVTGLVDPQIAVTPAQLALAAYLAESTLSPLSACIGLLLPAGLSQVAETRYSLGESPPGGEGLSPLQERLLGLLGKRGPLNSRQIDRALPRVDWRAAARGLARRGFISTQSSLPQPRTRPKSVRTAQLAIPPGEIESLAEALGKAGSEAQARRRAILDFLATEAGPVEAGWVYAQSGGKREDLLYLSERGLVALGEGEVWRDPLEGYEFIPQEPPPLTQDQERAWEKLLPGLQDSAAGKPVKPFLLHGVTSSGKTEIYLRAVAETVRQGRQAIVLVPEIALTPQTARRFLGRFPGQVGLVHSRLSPGERYDTWRRARLGELSVIVGPRSALFTPLERLGLIVVDECHDDSYYQGEGPPFFHAREAAVAYARLAGAACLLGSATPDLGSQHRAQTGKWTYLELPARILAHRQAVQAQVERLALAGEVSQFRPYEQQAETMELPAVCVADMRQELRAGNRSIFSQALQEALAQVLKQGQQAILFLNRRGTATYVFCRDCGQALQCPKCELPLTYHQVRNRLPTDPEIPGDIYPAARAQAQLTCHHCGYGRKMPDRCPSCGSARIRQYGTGTERVEAEVQALFPRVRTLRWDYETTRQKGAHEFILSHFANRRADVLIGTQMLAKGLDLPWVTLVGVVLADVGLNLPDIYAAERTFQVLTQVAGRAGRSPLGGQVILQTFQPEHYAIQAASRHDTEGFYRQELDYRRQLGYPPFTQLVRLEFRHRDSEQAARAAREMAGRVRGWLAAGERSATRMTGPVPCFFTRLNGQYRWQIVLRGPQPASLLRGKPLGEWRVEVNPPSLL
jgi:primosomal protein N' (replication factor Y) (superfamily II helicase)